MKRTRKIIEIDEDKCTGCGQCITACAEGALQIVNGKARLVGDILCDGMGACIGNCPEDALRIVKREAEDFDEKAVKGHLGKGNPIPADPVIACGCPSSAAMTFSPIREMNGSEPCRIDAVSRLGHWPVKLQLLSPAAPFLKGSDMLLLADCCGIACPDLHEKLLKGKTVAIACPKLDDVERHIQRLAEILSQAAPRELSIVHMEVPCCTGLIHAARKAADRAGVTIPMKHIVVSRRGDILAEEEIG
jgi:Fe-S-cluster-containing hydrogenase component 2